MSKILNISKSATVEIRGNSEEDFTHHFDEFRKEHGIHFVLAFSGGADDSSPQIEHVVKALTPQNQSDTESLSLDEKIKDAKDEYVARIIRDILRPLTGHKLAILTGGTNWGVPRVATRIANEFNIKTIGVFPLRATDDALINELDFSVCVHPMLRDSEWGDESPIFTKLLDGVIVMGGGAGTMVEVSHILKLNERYIKKDMPIKHIVPVLGTGGTADKLPFFPGKASVMSKCVPSKAFVDGTQVYNYLVENVLPSDVFDILN